MAVGDIYRVTIEGLQGAVTTINTSHWREGTAGTGNPAALLAAAIRGRVVSNWLPNMSDQWSFVGVTAQRIYPSPTGRAQFDQTDAGAGALNDPAAPPNAPFTVTFNTAFAGPKYRGRIFVSGYNESDQVDGVMQAGAIAAWQSIMDITFAAVSASGNVWNQVIWHRASSTYDAITDQRVRDVVRNLRRRQSGVGI